MDIHHQRQRLSTRKWGTEPSLYSFLGKLHNNTFTLSKVDQSSSIPLSHPFPNGISCFSFNLNLNPNINTNIDLAIGTTTGSCHLYSLSPSSPPILISSFTHTEPFISLSLSSNSLISTHSSCCVVWNARNSECIPSPNTSVSVPRGYCVEWISPSQAIALFLGEKGDSFDIVLLSVSVSVEKQVSSSSSTVIGVLSAGRNVQVGVRVHDCLSCFAVYSSKGEVQIWDIPPPSSTSTSICEESTAIQRHRVYNTSLTISQFILSPHFSLFAVISNDSVSLFDFGRNPNSQLLHHECLPLHTFSTKGTHTQILGWNSSSPTHLITDSGSLDIGIGMGKDIGIGMKEDNRMDWSIQLRMEVWMYQQNKKSMTNSRKDNSTSTTHRYMQQRILEGYSTSHVQTNIDITRDRPNNRNTDVSTFWSWLLLHPSFDDRQGVLSLLYPSKTECAVITPVTAHSTHQQKDKEKEKEKVVKKNGTTYYTSAQRNAALVHLGWTPLSSTSSSELVSNASMSSSPNELCTTVALLIFHLDIPSAIDLLQAQQPATALATMLSLLLAGCPQPPCASSPWYKTALTTPLPLPNPHPLLSAAIHFLANFGKSKPKSESKFDYILFNEDLSLLDRLAFACRFLPGSRLKIFMDTILNQQRASGSLCSLILVGMHSSETSIALERFMHKTKDIQTCALVASLCISSNTNTDTDTDTLTRMVEEYRDLLDLWGVWEVRALFDQQRISLLMLKDTPGPPNILLKCTFCNQSLTTAMSSNPKKRGNAMKSKLKGKRYVPPSHHKKMDGAFIRCCSHCRKPLPRCSVCLMGLTISSPAFSQGLTASGRPQASRPIDQWVSWCAECKHGGHHGHLKDWFDLHTVCPVASCDCPCGVSLS